MSAENIKICVRIRPELGAESSTQFREIAKAIGNKTVVFDPPDNETAGLKTIFKSQRNKDLKFAFDNVFGPETSQLDVYRCTTAPVLDDVLNGYNCCVFAYGATGAGKTFTMIGNKENPGVIFRTVMMLYQKIDALGDQYKYDVTVSYIEIYNEKLKDLLSPGQKLVLNENGEGQVTLRGVSMHQPSTADELLEMLHKGNGERTQTRTLANSESSRSHAIFQIYLRGRPKVSGTTNTWKHSKFSLIDLAGSERGNVTTNSKQQREGANINRSLLALGNVINALAERNKNSKIFIPYRDSKLTRLLKDSLGGSCQTIMIANLSPSSSSYEDTYNTLKYANRAKNIKVDMKENIVEVKSHVKEYEKIIADLKTEVNVLNKKLEKKEDISKRLELLEEFNATHEMFDKKCREVFRERAQYKREITVLEAEQHNLSSFVKQKELYHKLVATHQPNLVHEIQEELEVLRAQQISTTSKIEKKKVELEENVEQAKRVQQEIHEYIQFNSDKIPNKLGPQLLVQLWEYHLVKVQSYFAENSVKALQQAVATSDRQLQHMNNITEKMFDILGSSTENIPEIVREKLIEVCVELTDSKKKRGGIMWADNGPKDHPTSTLFPSPQLIQPSSPQISFTPGKILVGSTPQLNKLQAAYVHGEERGGVWCEEGFTTPAPSKLQACFKARFTPAASHSKLNLTDCFNSLTESVGSSEAGLRRAKSPAGSSEAALRRIKSPGFNKPNNSHLVKRLNNIKKAQGPRGNLTAEIGANVARYQLKSPVALKSPGALSDAPSDNSTDSVNTSGEDVLNGTFTMDQPTVLPTIKKPGKRAGSRKRSMIPAPSTSYKRATIAPATVSAITPAIAPATAQATAPQGGLKKGGLYKKPGLSLLPRKPRARD